LLACAHAPPPPSFSAFAPALELSSVGSTPYSYPERGQVLLVTFLATWCFPCIGQLALLDKEQRQHGARGFRIVAIGMDLEGAEVLEPFALEYQLPFPLLVADDRIRKGQSAFGPIPSLPAAFLFGRDGRLITAFVGLLAPAELDELIVRALEEAPRT
jgi:peroxiredoxin